MTATPAGRLEIYRIMAERGDVSSLREFVRLLNDQWRSDSEMDWRRRQQWKINQGMVEARRIPEDTRIEVLHSGPCAYCANPYPTQVDHVVPVSRGGGRRRRNLAPACWPCNKEKNGLTVEEWRIWRLSQGKCWPPLPRASGSTTAGEYTPATVPMPANYQPPPNGLSTAPQRRVVGMGRGAE